MQFLCSIIRICFLHSSKEVREVRTEFYPLGGKDLSKLNPNIEFLI